MLLVPPDAGGARARVPLEPRRDVDRKVKEVEVKVGKVSGGCGSPAVRPGHVQRGVGRAWHRVTLLACSRLNRVVVRQLVIP